ncbi:Serine/threonine-protein kinase PknF [Pirellula sp. SH-Sr6A]|uniref:serine/threonine protein kinase n=1 Tax=Pirellula sp. SH-Sr6A TaxID=1632865 RepID=UPI00078C0970|nr:serine/threonine-protein kinase [Pirellula sp. SH-Sr6A]AMV31163.1 Serine/threonine-protein kinase PknF [Pirellula sp. SH-Sr6A]
MSTVGTRIQAGFEPIPGYVLTKKIGSGGYGDVWAADAPGGLKKAIKFVHGAVHEDRAVAELKSLQRIRQVNHPFILSLERIEIIEGQLIIVTELAQGSLFDRYVEYRERGFAGIARDRLLSYLRDAADGLDFLCQKHELQHLDVKPGNLLLVSDRIKVADFGLVKDLHSMTQSMMGGLTPTYAAPEMFDGRPGRFSDQYSLAIVYFEMLTGTLPFRGRTTAQLANEHLHKAPILEPLPPAERPVIAKALSKRPHQRFSDCRELIHAIESAVQSNVEAASKERSTRVRGWNPRVNSNKITTRSPSSSAVDHSAPTRHRIRLSTQPASGAGSQPVAAVRPKTVVIGVGGIGAGVVAALNQRNSDITSDLEDQSLLFVLDTDANTLLPLVDRSNLKPLTSRQVFHTPLKSPHYYREGTHAFPQLSRRWLYNIPRSQLTEGVRPLGMLALIDHAPQVFEHLMVLLEGLSADSQPDVPVQVKLVASTMGGTGSSIVSELGFMIQQVAESMQLPIRCELLLTCASPSPTALGDLATACSIACLLEVNHYFRTGGLHPELPGIPAAPSSKPPFDRVRLFYGGKMGDPSDNTEVMEQVVRYIEIADPIDDASRCEDFESGSQSALDAPPWLSTIKVTPLPLELSIQPAKASATTVLHGLMSWISALDKGVSAAESPQCLLLSPKMLEKIEYFITDAFRVCNFNAQAWVRDVMRSVFPSEIGNQVQDFRSNYRPSACMLDDAVHLKRLVEPLGMDLSEAAIATQQLFECRWERLLEWITSRWIAVPLNWSIFPKLMELLEERFQVNAHSLFSVAKKLEAKLVELSESESQVVRSQSVMNLEGKVRMEAIFHQLSGSMLLRFIDRLRGIQQVWARCSRDLQGEFFHFSKDFCLRRFGYSIESFLSQNQQDKSDAIHRLSRESIADLVIRIWVKECGCQAIEAAMVGIPANHSVNGETASIADMLEALTIEIQKEIIQQSRTHEPIPRSKATALAQPAATNTLTQMRGGASPSESDFDLSEGNSMTLLGEISTGPIALDSARVATAIQGDADLDAKIDTCIPFLADYGESVHLHLFVSEMIWYQLPEELKGKLAKISRIHLTDRRIASYVVAVGDQIDVEELIDKLWMPTSETWQLVPRILSRVDIEWIPFAHPASES